VSGDASLHRGLHAFLIFCRHTCPASWLRAGEFSVEDPRCPPVSGCVRAELYIGGWVIRPRPSRSTPSGLSADAAVAVKREVAKQRAASITAADFGDSEVRRAAVCVCSSILRLAPRFRPLQVLILPSARY
jgi:hypothetical protein